jgi:alkyl hydroperoxide reductase subunit AhpC
MFSGFMALIVISSMAVFLLVQQNRGLSEILKYEEVPKIGDKSYLFTEKALGVQVIGIISEPELIARSYSEEHAIPFPVIADPDKKIFEKCRIRTVMLTVLVDKNGKILNYQNYGDGIKRTLEKIFIMLNQNEYTLQ